MFARADTTQALCKGYSSIRTALSELHKDSPEQAATRAEAVRMAQKLSLVETALMTIVWNKILTRFQATSESLQG